jgi:hypothetical protein
MDSELALSCLIIGIGSPNRAHDGRVVQCAIAVSEELGLIRFFADYRGIMSKASVWDRCLVRLQKTSKDSREESFKLLEIDVVGNLNCSFEKRSILNSLVLQPANCDPVDYQNDRLMSIAVVKPAQQDFEFAIENKPTEEPEDWFVTAKDLPHRARMTWRAVDGKQHQSHICAHEVMEGLRKNIASPWQVFNNMQVSNTDYEKWLVLGTMVKHRSSWLIVHVHRLKKTNQQAIGSNLWTSDGRKDGWPYFNKEARRVRNAAFDPQGYLFTMSDIQAS